MQTCQFEAFGALYDPFLQSFCTILWTGWLEAEAKVKVEIEAVRKEGEALTSTISPWRREHQA